jgi:hypothetical protein
VRSWRGGQAPLSASTLAFNWRLHTSTALTDAVAFTGPDDPPLTINLLGRRGFLDLMLFGLDEAASPASAWGSAMYLRVL